MAHPPYDITENFEKALCDYTGAPYAVAVDCCSHAIFLSLVYEKRFKLKHIDTIFMPKKTFPSVPCEVLHAGFKIAFTDYEWKGIYQLSPSIVWDSALRFTKNMYIPGSLMCISFTGPRKHLKLIKGGAILTDNEYAVAWLRSARMSGRHEVPFMEDNIKFAGWNFYLNPELSARGIMLMRQFYNDAGEAVENPDLELEYPDLSNMDAFKV